MLTKSSERLEQDRHLERSIEGPRLKEGPPRRFSRHSLLAITFVLIIAAIYLRHLIALATYAAGSELDSYILLVPFISIYLLFIYRNKGAAVYSSAPGFALPLMVFGLATVAIASFWPAARTNLSHNDYLTVVTFSFLCSLASGGFLLMGRKWVSANAFPLAFLAFMIPLPDHLVNWMETASKLGSTEAASLFFDLTGTPALRNGTIFQLPGIVIEVAQECSGIRSSWILMITSLLAARLFLRSPWRRALLVGFVIPLGIVRNGFRILVISLLCIHFGPEMIHSAIHKRGGPLFFALSLIPLFLLLLWWLRRGDSKAKANVRA